MDRPSHEESQDPAKKDTNTKGIEETTTRGGKVPESIGTGSLKRSWIMQEADKMTNA